jgi:hypothetical protein
MKNVHSGVAVLTSGPRGGIFIDFSQNVRPIFLAERQHFRPLLSSLMVRV